MIRAVLGKPLGKGGGARRGSPCIFGPYLSCPSYVKSYLLPDKQSKRKTAVKKRNLNPVFNEILRVRLRGRAGLPFMNRTSLPSGAGWQGQSQYVFTRRSTPPFCPRNDRESSRHGASPDPH